MGRLPLALLAVAVLLAGCGGADNSDKDPASQVPATGGLREKVREAQAVTAADFPAVRGRTLYFNTGDAARRAFVVCSLPSGPSGRAVTAQGHPRGQEGDAAEGSARAGRAVGAR